MILVKYFRFMGIPDFDHNHVLPPHLGNPTRIEHLSPYECTTLELCQRFSNTKERIRILKEFLRFRGKMDDLGIITGFQWIDGSFVENIEFTESRSPRDLDLVTFYGGLSSDKMISIKEIFPEFSNPRLSKSNYSIDHYPCDYTFSPLTTVQNTLYWTQLFTHKRNNVWKGILSLQINTREDDILALEFLNELAE